MGMLKDADKEIILKEFEKLSAPVKIINFTQEFECNYCKETNAILSEVAGLSDKIEVETLDFVRDKAIADKYGIDKIPATIITGGEDHRIKYYGIPSGYEFVSLLDDIKMISAGDSGLDQKTREQLKKLKEPLHIQVFVTPT